MRVFKIESAIDIPLAKAGGHESVLDILRFAVNDASVFLKDAAKDAVLADGVEEAKSLHVVIYITPLL